MSEKAITRYQAPLPTKAPAFDSGMDLAQLGKVFAASGFFSDAKQESQAVVKILAGAELGFPPIASMTGIFIVQGRITLSANLMAAAVKSSGRYNYRVLQLSAEICEIEFYENGDAIGRSSFTIAEAKTAGTQNLQKFPRNMLFARAMSNGCKWYCPDIFGGSPPYTPEELGAQEVHDSAGELVGIVPSAEPSPRQYPNADPQTGEIPEPKRKPKPQTLDEWRAYFLALAASKGWTEQQATAALAENVGDGEAAIEDVKALSLAVRNGSLSADHFDTRSGG